MYSQKWNCCFQNRIIMFCLPVPTLIHLWEIYIFPLPILLQGICGPILGIYKSLTDTWMWKFGLRPRNSQKRNTLMGFLYSVVIIIMVSIHMGRSVQGTYDPRKNVLDGTYGGDASSCNPYIHGFWNRNKLTFAARVSVESYLWRCNARPQVYTCKILKHV
jgi:hypothetical protein